MSEAKFTNRQKSIIHGHMAECAADLNIKEYLKIELVGISGQQTTPDADFLKLLRCVLNRAEFIDCNGTVLVDNFAAFISDGHNNMEQLPAVVKSCVDSIKGSPEEQAFQLYRCMFSQNDFKI